MCQIAIGQSFIPVAGSCPKYTELTHDSMLAWRAHVHLLVPRLVTSPGKLAWDRVPLVNLLLTTLVILPPHRYAALLEKAVRPGLSNFGRATAHARLYFPVPS
jgi:hypothetical protein